MIVDNIILDIECEDCDVIREAEKRLKKLGKSAETAGRIYKKSVDARHKNNIKFVYSVIFGEDSIKPEINIKPSGKPQEYKPIIAGFGPAGMFCAFVLARYGYQPIVFEMGADIDERVKITDRLFHSGILDEKTNVCFGEGGAGTFSDGKLTTRINDPLCGFILESFVKFGADEKILEQAKPHIGTDKIRLIVKNIREEIIRLGGEIYFNAEVTDINKLNGVTEVTINQKDKYKTCGLFLAAGHSSFKLYDLLIKRGFSVEPKAYSTGFRIEHKQSYIDELVYGKFAGHKNLPPAEYLLSHKKPDTPGVYTFCMCPGGIVVNSASENGALVTNGMSYNARSEANANAAVAVSILPEDYGGTIRGAFDFRRKLEQGAFNIKNSFAAPVQTLGDYIKNKTGNLEKSNITPSYTGEITEFDLNKLFPEFINRNIKDGLNVFDIKLRGYLLDNAVLTAPETRTSSAVRILRNSANLEAVGFSGIYPCGEGSGYAGGITSSAVDGIKCAIKYMERFKNK